MRPHILATLGGAGLAALVAASPLLAQEPVRRVTLEEAMALFAQNNLELQRAQAVAARDVEAARQERAYPNPLASVTHESLGDNGLSQSETYYMLTQPVVWPWRQGRRSRAAQERATAAAANLGADSAGFVFALKAAYVDAAAAEAVFAVVEQVTAVFRRAEQRGTALRAEGDISDFELKRLRIERARYEQRWTQAGLDLVRARRRLTALTDPDAAGQVAPVEPLAGDPPVPGGDSLEARALVQRGEIVAAGASLEAARAAAAATQWEWLPGVALTGGYKRQSDGFDGVFLGAALPLPLWDRKGGAVGAAAAEVEAAERDRRLARLRVVNDVREALDRYRSLERRAELIRDGLLSGTDDLLDVALTSYAEGELTLLELLDAAQAFHDAGTAQAELTADYWMAYYDLDRAVGGFADGDGDEREIR